MKVLLVMVMACSLLAFLPSAAFAALPTISSLTDTAVGSEHVVVTFNLADDADVHFILQETSVAAPSDTDVLADASFTGTSGANTKWFDGLDANTDYTLYLVATNTDGDSTLESVQFNTTNVGPTFTVAPAASGITQTSANLAFTLDDSSTVYMLCLAASAPAPTVAAVKAGTSLGAVDGAYKSGAATKPVSGLTAGTAYTVYLVASNNAGDSTIASVNITTLASDNASLTSLAGQAVTTGGGTGTVIDPFIASIFVTNSKSSIAAADLISAAGATATMYADDDFDVNPAITTKALMVGANTLYIRVVAADGISTNYYTVTVTRLADGVPLPTPTPTTPGTNGTPNTGDLSIAAGLAMLTLLAIGASATALTKKRQKA